MQPVKDKDMQIFISVFSVWKLCIVQQKNLSIKEKKKEVFAFLRQVGPIKKKFFILLAFK